MNFHVFKIGIAMNVYDHRIVFIIVGLFISVNCHFIRRRLVWAAEM